MAKFILPVSLLLLGALSCTRTLYVPVESTQSDTLVQVRHHADTIIVRDSVLLTERGDTTLKEVYHWRERVRLRTDTIYRSRTDTIRIPVTMPQPTQTSPTLKTRFINFLTRGADILVTLLLILATVALLRRFLTSRK